MAHQGGRFDEEHGKNDGRTPGHRQCAGNRVGRGAFAVGTTPQMITSYRAGVNGPRVDVTTTTTVTAKAKALGGGKVQFTVNGKPSRTGYINVYEAGVRIGHVKSDKYGDGVVVVQSTPGRRTFMAGFQVTGSDVGTTSITGTGQ